MLEQFPEKVRLVVKHFPLRNHPFAFPAAAASLAADRQGKFWPFHDALFANYSQLNDEKIRSIAQEVGLDLERYEADLRDPALRAQIGRDVRDAQAAEVRGTPTIFVNGRLLRQRDLAGFRRLIEEELERLDSPGK